MKNLIKQLSILTMALLSSQAIANTGNVLGSDVLSKFYNTHNQTNQHSQTMVKPTSNDATNMMIGANGIVAIADGQMPQTVNIKSKESLIPTLTISNLVIMKTVIIPLDNSGEQVMDVSTLDGFINSISASARHYPPNFSTKTEKYHVREHIERYVKWIATYADADNASYEVLMRAAQLNGMARNLDMGSDYAVRASSYVGRALKLKPKDLDANLLYGIMLSEGGAFKTSLKYLNKAAKMGSIEAEQTIAQSDLMNDKRDQALLRLQNLSQRADPKTFQQIAQQIAIIEAGKYRIWDLPAPVINIKPLD